MPEEYYPHWETDYAVFAVVVDHLVVVVVGNNVDVV
jgi:hypothetical protein